MVHKQVKRRGGVVFANLQHLFGKFFAVAPFGKIDNFPELKRKITTREYENVLDYAMSLGIENMFYQDKQSASTDYIPQWDF